MAIDFTLTEEQKALQRQAREFAQEVLKPLVAQADAEPDPQKGFQAIKPAYVQAYKALAYIVEVERYQVKVGGREDVAPVALRVTSVFRREDAVWKITHRHADPITSVQPAESVIQK
jgi:alkylation response protein AidB-like acyl-CoA dehydrogenase